MFPPTAATSGSDERAELLSSAREEGVGIGVLLVGECAERNRLVVAQQVEAAVVVGGNQVGSEAGVERVSGTVLGQVHLGRRQGCIILAATRDGPTEAGAVFARATAREIRPFLGMKMHRASAPFMQCIMFGWFFAIQIPWATNLFWERRKLMPWIIGWFVLPVGVIATVSAGPMMMAAMSFLITALFPLRKYWKFLFGAAGGAYAIVSMVAKR